MMGQVITLETHVAKKTKTKKAKAQAKVQAKVEGDVSPADQLEDPAALVDAARAEAAQRLRDAEERIAKMEHDSMSRVRAELDEERAKMESIVTVYVCARNRRANWPALYRPNARVYAPPVVTEMEVTQLQRKALRADSMVHCWDERPTAPPATAVRHKSAPVSPKGLLAGAKGHNPKPRQPRRNPKQRGRGDDFLTPPSKRGG